MIALGFYSGLSGRIRTVYLFSLCVVSLLSSRFTASALVWFSTWSVPRLYKENGKVIKYKGENKNLGHGSRGD
jgi:hypothetical protein